MLFLWVTFLDFFNILLRRSSPSFNLFLSVDFFLEFWRILLSRPSTSFKLFLWVKILDFLTLRWEGLQPVLGCFCGLISGFFLAFRWESLWPVLNCFCGLIFSGFLLAFCWEGLQHLPRVHHNGQPGAPPKPQHLHNTGNHWLQEIDEDGALSRKRVNVSNQFPLLHSNTINSFYNQFILYFYYYS